MLKSDIRIYFLLLLVVFFSTSCSIFSKKQKSQISDELRIAETSLLIDAVKEKNIGNFESSIVKFNSLIRRNPNNMAANFQLSQLYRLIEKFDLAEEYAKKAYDLSPQNEWVKQNLVEIYEATKKFTLASKIREELIKNNPSNTDYYYDLVMDYVYSSKWEEAINTYDRLEVQQGISEEVSLAKHRMWSYLKNENKAANEIQKLIYAFPAENRYPLLLGDYYLAIKQFQKAKEQYQNALSLNNRSTYMSLAEYYKLTNNPDSSDYCLRAAFSEASVVIDSKISILLSYYKQIETRPELIKKANILLDSMERVHFDDPKYWSIKADFALLDSQPEKAKAAFVNVLKYDKSKYVIWEELLKIYTNEQKFDSALVYCNQAIELFPSQPFLFYIKGICYFMVADYSNAVSALEMGKNLVIEPNLMYLEMYIYLGESYHKLQNHPRSDAAFDKVLELDGKNGYVLNNYSYYLSLRGEKLEKAEYMAKKLITVNPNDANYLDTYAWVLFKLQKYAEALPIIEKAISLGSDKKSDVMEHYGDILWKSGNTNRALEAWEKALKLGSNSNSKLIEKVNKKVYVD